MNATLWVIWSAVTIAALFAGLAIGSHLPARHLLDAKYWDGRRDEAKVIDRFREQALDRAWREGYEKGCNDELASCAPCEHEPLARGAGPTVPVTTTPCPSENVPLKGDSPGPPPVTIYDQLAADFAARHAESHADGELYEMAHSERFRPTTPLASPPGGVAPEPSAPVLAPVTRRDDPGAEVKPPAPVLDETAPSGPSGAGADPWQEIVAANQEVWEPFTDTDVFRRISGDLDALRSALSAPVQLPPWKDSQ